LVIGGKGVAATGLRTGAGTDEAGVEGGTIRAPHADNRTVSAIAGTNLRHITSNLSLSCPFNGDTSVARQ
jgi:hypothetical protein